jgi:DNA-binding NarL/FixJ family response regulator
VVEATNLKGCGYDHENENLKGDSIMAKALDPKVKAQRALARRNEKIVELRNKGLSLKAIAEKFNITGPRVYKIITAQINA